MIPDFIPRKPLSAKHLNDLVAGINGVSPLTGNGAIAVTTGKGGATIALDPAVTNIYAPIIGRVTNAGPAAESNYLDERYWVKIQKNLNIPDFNEDDDALDLANVVNGEGVRIITAHSVGEWVEATHANYYIGQYVVVLPILCDEGIEAGPKLRYVIVSGGPSPLRVHITGSAAGGGKYLGEIWHGPTADISASGNITAAEMGSAGPICLALNSVEQGTAFNAVAIGTVWDASLLRVNANGDPVVLFTGVPSAACSV